MKNNEWIKLWIISGPPKKRGLWMGDGLEGLSDLSDSDDEDEEERGEKSKSVVSA